MAKNGFNVNEEYQQPILNLNIQNKKVVGFHKAFIWPLHEK
jgi:hypothetical protein